MNPSLSSAQALVERGMTVIDLPTHHLILPVIQGFEQFLKEPPEYRSAWTIDWNDEGDPDDGYIHRDGGPHDRKSFFHYRSRLRKRLSDDGVEIIRYQGWLEACHELFTTCLRAVQQFAPHLDDALPGFDFCKLIHDKSVEKQHVLRLLYYDQPGTSGPEEHVMAKAHTDRCFVTLHVAEQRPGLRLGKERQPYIAQPNKVLVFPGKKAAILTNGRLQAMEHDVIDAPGEDTRHNRWSTVFFSHINLPSAS